MILPFLLHYYTTLHTTRYMILFAPTLSTGSHINTSLISHIVFYCLTLHIVWFCAPINIVWYCAPLYILWPMDRIRLVECSRQLCIISKNQNNYVILQVLIKLLDSGIKNLDLFSLNVWAVDVPICVVQSVENLQTQLGSCWNKRRK